MAKAEALCVVYSVSCMHYFCRFDYKRPRSRGYHANKHYLLTWLNELQVRMAMHPEYRHIIAHGVHPGFVASGLFIDLDKELDKHISFDVAGWIMRGLQGYLAIDSKEGSLAIVNAATSVKYGVQANSGTDGLRGGAHYFNRIWPGEPMPQVRSAGRGKIVWDYVSAELKLQERLSLGPGVKRFAA